VPPALAVSPAGAQHATVTVTASPALAPAFDPAIPDYVLRCQRKQPVQLSVTASSGATVSVDSEPFRAGAFTTAVPLSAGQSFRLVVRAGAEDTTYRVRCLPADFPDYAVETSGTSQAAFYVVDPCCHRRYVIIFDSNGVPVWWLRLPNYVLESSLLPNGNIGVGVDAGGALAQGMSNARFSEYRLDGTFVRTFSIPDGTPTDRHELKVLPNGDYLVVAHVPRRGVNLHRFGGPRHATVFDGMLAEVSPRGRLLWSWSSKGHIRLAETGRWFKGWVLRHPARLAPGHTGYDIVHINSVEPYRHGFLVSFRHLDAIYYIRKPSGRIVWKLGGTHTSRSLRIIGDRFRRDFGGQHDARVLPDGTVTLFDNGTGRRRPPRALRSESTPGRTRPSCSSH
jgi:Arylsulfotransferase (ASST)